MPRSKAGVTCPSVNKGNLKTAVENVPLRQYSVCQAAENNKISKTTLLRHLKSHRSAEEETFTYKSNIAYRKIFSDEVQKMNSESWPTSSPHIIRPFPKSGPRKEEGKKRRKGKTKILTDTPIRNEIEEYKSARNKAKNSAKTL